MDARISKRISKYNLTTELILKEIYRDTDLGKDNFVILYSSVIDGIGTEYSDLDIYVFTDYINLVEDAEDYGLTKVRQCELNGLCFDIEYKLYENINSIISILNNNVFDLFKLSEGEMKILHRINVSDIIQSSERGAQLRGNIDKKILNELYYGKNRLAAYAELDDAVKFYFSQEYHCAISCLFKVLDLAAGAYCARNNRIVVNSKWYPKVMLEIVCEKKDINLKNNYLQFQFGNIETNEKYTKDKIMFVQDLLFAIGL